VAESGLLAGAWDMLPLVRTVVRRAAFPSVRESSCASHPVLGILPCASRRTCGGMCV